MADLSAPVWTQRLGAQVHHLNGVCLGNLCNLWISICSPLPLRFCYTSCAIHLTVSGASRFVQNSETENITQLLIELTNGNHAVVDGLLPLIYGELRSLAANYLRRERSD